MWNWLAPTAARIACTVERTTSIAWLPAARLVAKRLVASRPSLGRCLRLLGWLLLLGEQEISRLIFKLVVSLEINALDES
eukprot:COSAG02_NODE_5617_length_4179_cov_6.227451_5_plen_79_part_01